MRDDIHKGAPVPRSFRLALEGCLNEAMWATGDAHQRGRGALDYVLTKISEGNFPSRLAHWIENQGAYLSVCSENPDGEGIAKNTEQQHVIAHASRIGLCDGWQHLTAPPPILAAYQEMRDQYLRAVDVYLTEKHPAKRRQAMPRLAQILRESESDSHAKILAIIEGRQPNTFEQMPSLSLDLALPAGPSAHGI